MNDRRNFVATRCGAAGRARLDLSLQPIALRQGAVAEAITRALRAGAAILLRADRVIA